MAAGAHRPSAVSLLAGIMLPASVAAADKRIARLIAKPCSGRDRRASAGAASSGNTRSGTVLQPARPRRPPGTERDRHSPCMRRSASALPRSHPRRKPRQRNQPDSPFGLYPQ